MNESINLTVNEAPLSVEASIYLTGTSADPVLAFVPNGYSASSSPIVNVIPPSIEIASNQIDTPRSKSEENDYYPFLRKVEIIEDLRKARS